MKRALVLILLLLACGGNDAREVQQYLAVTDQVMFEFSSLGDDFNGLSGELQAQVKAHGGNPAGYAALAQALEPKSKRIEIRIQELLRRVNQEKAPKPALMLHRTLISALNSFQGAAKALTALCGEAKQGKTANTSRLAKSASDMHDHLQGVLSEGDVYFTERLRLIDEYSIKLDDKGRVPPPK